MKKIIFSVLIVFMLISHSYAVDYLIPDSDKVKLNEEGIKGRNKVFYRYARNEIFARKGYIFKDKELMWFFLNMSWYKPSTNSVPALSTIETENVELIKSMEEVAEDDLKTYRYPEVYHRYELDKKPLFYVTMDMDEYMIPHLPLKRSGFILMNESFKWALNTKSIPVEYLLSNCESFIEIADVGESLDDGQIKLQNIDSDYNKTEISVYLDGPSDDDEYVVIGYDNENRLKQWFCISGDVQETKCVSKNKIIIRMKVREDLFGTMWMDKEYLYDIDNNSLSLIPEVFDTPNLITSGRCKNSIVVYSDPVSAAKKTAKYEIGKTDQNETLDISRVYFGEDNNAWEVSYRDYINGRGTTINGWINQDDVNRDNFSLQYAD